MDDYAPTWLDELCTAGRTTWTRLRPAAATAGGSGAGGGGGGAASSLRATPILLLPRKAASTWAGIAAANADADADADADAVTLGARARRVVDFLADHGASFFDEIADGCRLLRAEAEDALAELVVRGRVNADSYAGLRALLVPPSKRAATSSSGRARRRMPLFGIADAGRWSLVRSPRWEAATPTARAEALEHVARTLLRRWGVVCWRLMEREAAWLPPWRDLVRVYRRLEARGEVRGGRFIAGLSGEQYALPEAIATLRQVRRQPRDGALVVLSASDPANLQGSVLAGPRVPRIAGARVAFQDGLGVASLVGGQVEMLVEGDDATRQRVARALVQGGAGGGQASGLTPHSMGDALQHGVRPEA